MHEAHAGDGAGQRLQQLDAPLGRDEVHHHQVDAECLQVRAIPDEPTASAVGPGRGVQPAAAAPHLVLVILRDAHADLRDLVLLVAIHDPQIERFGQLLAALAPPLRKPLYLIIRPLRPGQVHPRRAGLLAPPALGATSTSCRLLRRRRPTRIVVLRRRRGGVARVPREQVLQPGQLSRQLLVDLQQIHNLCGQRRDLPVLGRDPRIPLRKERDQPLARYLLRRGHPKITLRPDHRIRDQHARSPNSSPSKLVCSPVMHRATAIRHHPIRPPR